MRRIAAFLTAAAVLAPRPARAAQALAAPVRLDAAAAPLAARMSYHLGDLSQAPRILTAPYPDLPASGTLENERVRIVARSLVPSAERDQDLGHIETVTVPRSRRGDFVHPAGSEHFVSLNAFYQVNEAVKHFESLGYVYDGPVTVLVGRAEDDALYQDYSSDPKGRYAVFEAGRGIQGAADLRRNPVVISHEIFHVVFNRMHVAANPSLRGKNFMLVLHEAFADYFSKSFHEAPGPTRDIRRYPEDLPEGAPFDPNHYGHVLAHELWELRASLVRQGLAVRAIDRILFQSLEVFGTPGTSPENLYFGFLRRVQAGLPKGIAADFDKLFHKFNGMAAQ